jgi:hypothetical protein
LKKVARGAAARICVSPGVAKTGRKAWATRLIILEWAFDYQKRVRTKPLGRHTLSRHDIVRRTEPAYFRFQSEK